MADADWHKYKQLRGHELPESARLLDTDYVREHVLERDFYTTVGIFERRDDRAESPPLRVLLKTEVGRPVLIDYQIALAPYNWHWPVVGWPARAFVRFGQQFDRYHVDDLHTRARPEDFTAESRHRVRDKPLVIRLHGALVRKPYRAVRHAVLRRWMMADNDQSAA